MKITKCTKVQQFLYVLKTYNVQNVRKVFIKKKKKEPYMSRSNKETGSQNSTRESVTSAP